MKCKKVRRLLLTDYSDGQLEPDKASLVRDHLFKCKGCFEFQREIESAVLEPFKREEKSGLSEYELWHLLQERFESKPKFFQELAFRFSPALRAAFKAAPLLVIIFVLWGLYLKPVLRLENIDLRYFAQEFYSDSALYQSGYGTIVEEYFL
jgi:anti-sigma factor RsiW